jgi:hypothetical protein
MQHGLQADMLTRSARLERYRTKWHHESPK